MKRTLQSIQYFLSPFSNGFTMIPSFSRKRTRLTYEDEVVPSYQMTCCSSSCSSNAPQIKYDVFISFRGSDTRDGFLSHLLDALSRAKIDAFVDYKLKEGEELSQAFSRAIQESKIALVIFSRDYASSRWCLEELVKITECMMKNGQIVVPIFYKVDPSDVRHQKGCYKSAFAKHEKLPKGNITNVENWRSALKIVANLSGFHYSSNNRTEAELIEVVTRRVLKRLDPMCKVNIKGLVGIDKPIADLRSLISCIKSEDVGVIGIWGMGGLGKTTIASVLFNTMCSEFEGCCFLANVREQVERDGINHVKSELFSNLLEENDLNTGIPIGVPTHVERRLRRKKILIVLDDVNNPNQVRSLIDRDWFGPGSRIIVTTRDRHVIEKEADCIYKVKALGSHDAAELLKLHAFDEKYPQMNWHDELMTKVLEYAKGIPLALEVLGSFLYGKRAKEWESQLQKLQKMPFADIHTVLRLSYEGLDREDQNIFLCLACFFWNDDSNVIKLLEASYGYSPYIGLKTLEDKALITFRYWDDEEKVSMHDLIREMGREIVREQNEKPGKRKHLWDHNEICHVLNHDEGSKNIESISMDTSRIGDISLSPDCLAGMINLKLLRFHNYSYGTNIGLHLPEQGLGKLSSNIRLFHWYQYPSKSLPMTLNAENLVELCMKNSHIKKLWNGVQNLPNLKSMDLWGSKKLIELPNLSKASSLEYLDLEYCENLVSIQSSIMSLPNIKVVRLLNCRRLEEFAATKALPFSDRFRSKLERLYMTYCKSLKRLPDSMSKLTSLSHLSLTGCNELDTSNLQIIFDGLHSLISLRLSYCCNLYELPESIKHLPRLLFLYLNGCKLLQSVPELPPSIVFLNADYCTSLERVFTPSHQLLEQHITFATQNKYVQQTTEFSFRNCPKLNKDALDAIEAYVKCCNERKKAADQRRGS